MNESPMWRFEHTVECPVSRDLAWAFWTDVNNWAVVDPAVEWVKLDGPFAAGTRGATKPVESDMTEWQIVEVQPGESAIIEIAVPGATLRFTWLFADSTSGGTVITQQVNLEGERAGDYAVGLAGLEKGIPDGMQKLVDAIARAGNSAA